MDKIFNLKVVPGIKKGTELGFPTINLETESITELEFGVYTCITYINNEEFNGIMHYGPKTIGTEDKGRIYCEIHLLNIHKELNLQQVKVKVLKKIRSVREFNKDEDLKNQIQKDIEVANKYFSHVE